MTTVAVAPLTVAAGGQVFGPVTVPEGWTSVVFSLEIASLTSADVLAQYRPTPQAPWQHLLSETGLRVALNAKGVPVTSETLRGTWSVGQPAGEIQVTVTTPTPFLSSGGSLVVT